MFDELLKYYFYFDDGNSSRKAQQLLFNLGIGWIYSNYELIDIREFIVVKEIEIEKENFVMIYSRHTTSDPDWFGFWNRKEINNVEQLKNIIRLYKIKELI